MERKEFYCILITLSVISVANGLSLALSARDLPSMDVFDGAPDPYVIVYYAANSSLPFVKVGETENISDNRNPDWPEVFNVTTNDGDDQWFRFDVFDADYPDADDYMGVTEVNVNDILEDVDGVLTQRLFGGNPGGGDLLVKRQ